MTPEEQKQHLTQLEKLDRLAKLKLTHGHRVGTVYRPKRYRQKLYEQDPTCRLCFEIIETPEEATLDHILPRFHGGHTTKMNLQLAHKHCNLKKGHQV